MTAPDAPQVEPLKLTLEEALARIGERGYTLAVYHHKDAPREYVLHDVDSAFALDSFGHWKDAVEAVLGVPVVPRDPTAELVEALEAVTKAEYDPGVGEYAITVATMRRVQAALARVKEQR